MKAFFASSAPYALAREWTGGLWEEKAKRIERMRREADKALVLTAHRLLFYALKAVYGILPCPQDFGLEAQGKPYLITTTGVHFSISHSGSMAMCALHNEPVGADIEKIRAVGEGVPERVMSSAEYQLYMNADDRQSLFFQIWTLKEAYVKYSGDGLGVPLSSFTVCPSGGSVITDTGCTFWTAQPASGYEAAVCTRNRAGLELVMVSEQQLTYCLPSG
jgi:4'-phosphopantetheinyl transferase